VQALPAQERGTRPARALPYALAVQGEVDAIKGELGLRFVNSGTVAAVFQVRAGSGAAGPWTYTVGAGAQVSDSLAFAAAYDFSVYGPNGFFRGFKGSVVPAEFALEHRGGRPPQSVRTNLETEASYDLEQNGVTLKILNRGTEVCPVTILDGYTKKVVVENVQPGATASVYFALAKTYGWYDLVVTSKLDAGFERHLAGHVETGKESRTDPAIGA
jgi:phospholipase C